MSKKKVLIVAGGTGGHMFPAQALALELIDLGYEVSFAGAKLDQNQYFRRDLFKFVSIVSATVRMNSGMSLLKSISILFLGFLQSMKFIISYKPDLTIGFGSFHTAPLLAASVCVRSRFILFESNALPGKVNRFFSRFSQMNALQFEQARRYVKGITSQVFVPFWQHNQYAEVSKQNALNYYGLSNKKLTILIFGGSQGAASLNNELPRAIFELISLHPDIQVIHFSGASADVNKIFQSYQNYQIPVCVKNFEERMEYAWSAADVVICRSGAATIAEILRFSIPSILIPFPKASENHQTINAMALQEIGASLCLQESKLDTHCLVDALRNLAQEKNRLSMKKSIEEFNQSSQKEKLVTLVQLVLEKTK